MNYDDHCVCLGRLWGNLQSLEITLRLFLTQANPSENYIISRNTFGTLVRKYNGQLSTDEPYPVDKTVVKVRNALAHGLVSGRMKGFPLTLLHKDVRARHTRREVTIVGYRRMNDHFIPLIRVSLISATPWLMGW